MVSCILLRLDYVPSRHLACVYRHVRWSVSDYVACHGKELNEGVLGCMKYIRHEHSNGDESDHESYSSKHSVRSYGKGLF